MQTCSELADDLHFENNSAIKLQVVVNSIYLKTTGTVTSVKCRLGEFHMLTSESQQPGVLLKFGKISATVKMSLPRSTHKELCCKVGLHRIFRGMPPLNQPVPPPVPPRCEQLAIGITILVKGIQLRVVYIIGGQIDMPR